MNKRTNQNGSVVTFVIVGVVLAAVVAGGVYLVNQRSKQASSSQPTSSQSAPVSTGEPSSRNTEDQSGASSSSSSSNSQTSTSPSTSVTSPSARGGRLPTTGPAEDGLRLVFVGILAGIATAYVRSRQQRRQLLSL